MEEVSSSRYGLLVAGLRAIEEKAFDTSFVVYRLILLLSSILVANENFFG